MTDTPVGPTLSLQYFIATDPTNSASTVAAVTTTVAAGQMGDLADAVGSAYNADAPFHALFTGSFDTSADGGPTTYYFRLPAAEGAVLTIDGQLVIYAPGRTGDANLDGR